MADAASFPTIEGSAWLEGMAEAPDAEAAPGVTNAELLALHARPAGPPGAIYEQDVLYATVDGLEITLDLFRREDTSERRPAVVFVHGGGWGAGSRWFHMRHCHELAAAGFVTVTIGYRLAHQAPWPAPLDDAKAAIGWVREHAASLGADADRIAVGGGSAGGHISALVALDPAAAVKTAVLWYPATDLLGMPFPVEMREALSPYFHGEERAASPVNNVHAGAPPILTITGAADPLTTVEHIRAFHEALTAADVENRLEVFDGKGHGFDLFPEDWQASYDLLHAWLVDRL